METKMPEPTTEDLRQAIGGLLTVLGSMVPPQVAGHMATQLREFAGHCSCNRQATVGTLATGFAKALDTGASVPTPPRH
jgi:hypothetical protein